MLASVEQGGLPSEAPAEARTAVQKKYEVQAAVQPEATALPIAAA